MSHTPGPWKIKREVIKEVNIKRLSVWSKDFRVATIASSSDSHLIAAAPELLEACRYLVSHASGDAVGQVDVISLARKAIAKAEGKSD